MKKIIVIILGCLLLIGIIFFYLTIKTHYVVTIKDIRIEVDYTNDKSPKVIIKNNENTNFEIIFDDQNLDTFLLSNNVTNSHIDIKFKEHSHFGISQLFVNRTTSNAKKTDFSIIYDERGISEINMEDEVSGYKEKKVFGGFHFYQGSPYLIDVESITPPPYVQADFHPDAVLHYEQKGAQELWYITDYYETPSVYLYNWKANSYAD